MSAGQRLEGRRLLVVEDDYFLADEMMRALKASGAEIVGPVASVGDALALIDASNGTLDGAMLDINLRGEPAYPVADALLERGVPFVFATGYDDTTIPHRYAKVMRCEKPVELGKLLRVLGR